ncbi:MAG: flagellar hook-basal body complex protein [Clostridiales bacterium]
MNRAMFSGVAGMKTHQTKLDVIGNNIANVNTYGYKSQRAIFSDVFYQTLNGASQGTASRGGTNPSTVGYGSSLASIQTQMSQSSMQNTGFGLDVAITGEGFLQVMDADGNIFYTKAGLLDYDANGYLVDVNGNFVLGASDVNGRPNTQKIKLDGVGAVSPVAPKASQEINGITYTLTGSNATKDGNVGISLTSGQLPIGEKAKAVISNSGSITVQLNANEVFSSLTELNNEINKAIVLANNNQPHAAGTFTLTMTDAAGNDASYKFTNTIPAGLTGGPGASGASFLGGATITEVSPDFNGVGALDFSGSSFNAAGDLVLRAEAANGRVYSVTIPYSDLSSARNVTLSASGGGAVGSMTMAIPDLSTMIANTVGTSEGNLAANINTYLASGTHDYEIIPGPPQSFSGAPTDTNSLLGGAVIDHLGTAFSGANGALSFSASFTPGGDLILRAEDSAGKVYSVTIPYGDLSTARSVTLINDPAAPDDSITMTIPDLTTIIGNTVGMAEDNLENNFSTYLSNHSYEIAAPRTSTGLTGEQIAVDNYDVTPGKISGFPVANFKFEGASNDFRGEGPINAFGLTHSIDADGAKSWTVSMNIGGKIYSGTIPETAVGSSLLLKGPGGDSIQLGIPSFSYINSLYGTANPGSPDPVNNSTLNLMDGTQVDPPFGSGNTATPSIPSSNLGLSSVGFNMAGGTVGGPVTLDQLSSIAIGNDGTISVSHPDKGTINVGKVSLANFANPRGLLQEGTNYYSETVNSGKAVLCDPGTNGTGGLKSNSLEMSNVDLSQEFADMITTQRGFQANTRVITVSDTMLEELINLKR